MNFQGPAKRLEDIDLPRIAHAIGCGEDEIHAVIDVETSGDSSDDRGRLKMLFEPHRFWKNLGPGAKRDRAAVLGLAYPVWGTRPYPGDSYPRLRRAMAIDETAALKSASWGLGQILGENHAEAGYPTVQAMIADFTLDEDNHLEAMVRFIRAAGLDEAIRAHDWTAFARRYNGPHQARHGYAVRLARRFAWWSGIRDTPWSPDPTPPAPPAKSLLSHLRETSPMTTLSLAPVVLDVIDAAIRRAGSDPAIPIEPRHAAAVAEDVTAAVAQDPRFRDVAAQVEHATNAEPWYQSRVTWGAVLTGLASVASAFGIALAPEDREVLVGILAAAGSLFGAALTLYGRWRARRPIGALR